MKRPVTKDAQELDEETTADVVILMVSDAIKSPGPVGFKGVGSLTPWSYFNALMMNEHPMMTRDRREVLWDERCEQLNDRPMSYDTFNTEFKSRFGGNL